LAIDALGLPGGALPQVTLHPLFADHAVLQRDKELCVFGRAQPGERVEVQLGASSAETSADAEGRFVVRLAAQPMSAEPLTLIASAASGRAHARDILLGDVWLAGGQSNMEFPLSASDSPKDIDTAQFAQIRQFAVEARFATTPQREVKGQWSVCSPATAGAFSAVAFAFARRVHLETGVPIGILKACVGGTGIELWIAQDTLLGAPELEPFSKWMRASLATHEEELKQVHPRIEEWTKAVRAAQSQGKPLPPEPEWPEHPFGERRSDPRCVTLYNGMIHPLLPFRIAGILWYQGENNAGTALDAEQYTHKLRILAEDWRRRFEQPDLPFYFVQLAAWQYTNYEPGNTDSWAFLREGQRRTLAVLPNSGMAVAIDIGDEVDIHPKNKFDVGERLALWALRDRYGRQQEVSGPLFRELVREAGALRVLFDHAESGLMAGRKAGREAVQPDPKGIVRGFAIAGSDQRWKWAKARIEGSELVLSHPDIPEPVAARYAFSSNPDRANLYNQAGLPASPFRSDSW
jgi:sialate O-acetylesterase